MSGSFIDTNVLIYSTSADAMKSDRAEDLLIAGGTISVQVLNEVTNVARRKLKMSWPETHRFLSRLRSVLSVESLTTVTHEMAMTVAERYLFATYDSVIVASALLAGCDVLWSEDMQDGLLVDGKLRIRNPFGPLSATEAT